MKKLQILLSLAAVLLTMTGCKKDNEKSGPSGETVTFTANIGGGEKTEIYEGSKMKWSENDAITINGDVFTSEFPLGDYTAANFVGTFTSTPTEYKAYYPETLYDKESDEYVLPATQIYAGNTLSSVNPMYAYQPDVNTKTLQFHNICALVKLSVKGTGTVRTIVVTSDDYLCGKFTVSKSDSKYYAVISEGEGGNTLALDCGAGVDLSSETPTTFYIALPDGNLKNLVFKIGGYESTPMNVNLTAGKLYAKTLEDVAAPTIEFSVSATQKVKFAPGNLYYDGSEFRFEASQTAYTTTWNASHVDRFFWSKTASVAYAQDYSDDNAAKTDVFFTNATQTTANKGFHVAGETAGTWRTLSKVEWVYLLNTSGSSGRTNDNRFAKAKVNDVKGLLIFPDNYTLPEGYSTAAGGTGMAKVNKTSSSDAPWPGADIPTEKWALMESSGVVFLPAAGYRDSFSLLNNVGSDSYYWSSTCSDKDKDVAYYLRFNSGSVNPQNHYNRYVGYAVRLVR